MEGQINVRDSTFTNLATVGTESIPSYPALTNLVPSIGSIVLAPNGPGGIVYVGDGFNWLPVGPGAGTGTIAQLNAGLGITLTPSPIIGPIGLISLTSNVINFGTTSTIAPSGTPITLGGTVSFHVVAGSIGPTELTPTGVVAGQYGPGPAYPNGDVPYFQVDTDGRLDVAGTTAFAGDISGPVSNVTVVGLQTRPVSNAVPAVGNVLTFNGAQWIPSPAAAAGVTTFSAGTTGFTPVAPTAGAVTLAGILVPANGGTGVANNNAFTITLGGSINTGGAVNVNSLSISQPLTISGGASGGTVLAGTGPFNANWQTLSLIAVTSATGTANQVFVNGDLGSHSGAITLSLPQSIATTSSPTFNSLTLTNPLTGANGGTGVNNGAFTITVGGNLSTFAALTISNAAAASTVLTGTGANTAAWMALPSLGVTSIASNGGAAETGAISLINGTNVSIIDSPAGTFTFNVPTGAGGVTTFSAGTTGLTPIVPASGAVTLGGTLIALNGGTGFSGYTVGDLLYSDTPTTLAKLPDAVVSNALISGGVGVAPSWGKISNATLVNSSLTVTAGTGLSGGGLVSLGGSVTLNNAGVLSVASNGGAAEVGAISLINGTNISIVDSPAGTFTFNFATGGGGSFTQGSVLFAGPLGVISQDNSKFYWDDTNFALGIGTIPAATAVLDVVNNTGITKAVQTTGYGSNVGYRGRYANGTLASPTATVANNILSFMSGRGYGTTGFAASSTGVMNIVADGATFTDTSMPTRLGFSVTPTGSVTSAEAMRLTSGGNLLDIGFFKAGGLTNPLNTTAGDVTGTRLMIGSTDTTFSTTAGEFMIVNGMDTTSGAGSAIGISIAPQFGPTTTLSGTVTGTQHTAMTSSDNTITGSIIGSSSLAQLNGSGDIVTPIGLFGTVALTGNKASRQGLLTVTVGSSGGTGYSVNDVLTVTGGGGTGGTVTVLTVGGGGVVLTVVITNPGSGYSISVDNATTVVPAGGTGALITILTRGSTTIGNPTGIRAQGITANGSFVTPTVTIASAISVINSDLGSGPISLSTQNGILIQNLNAATNTNVGVNINAFTGTTTTNIGVNVAAFTSTGTTNAGIRIATPSGATNNYALQFVTQSTVPAGGIQFGSGADSTLANMYRSAAGRVRTDGEMQAQHFLCVSGLPTIAVGAGAGATGSVALTANSTDAGLQVTVTVAGSLAAAANATVFVLTYAATYSSTAQFVVFSPANAAAAALASASMPFVSANTTTTFTFRSNATAIPVGTYIWNYSVRA